MKKFLGTIIHIALALSALLLCTSKLNGQSTIEMIPHELVPTVLLYRTV
mgnify:CR=1